MHEISRTFQLFLLISILRNASLSWHWFLLLVTILESLLVSEFRTIFFWTACVALVSSIGLSFFQKRKLSYSLSFFVESNSFWLYWIVILINIGVLHGPSLKMTYKQLNKNAFNLLVHFIWCICCSVLVTIAFLNVLDSGLLDLIHNDHLHKL